MPKVFLKFFLPFLLFYINLYAVDFSLLTKPMYNSITKYYGDKDIEIVNIKKSSDNLFKVKVITEDEIDDIIIDSNGKIKNITENLEDIEIDFSC